MDCSVCQRETSAIKIGGQTYCSNCGTPVGAAPDQPAAVPARRVTMDLVPRPAGAAPRPAQPAPRPAQPAPRPHQPAAQPAAALHGRLKPARILDLRTQAAPAPKAPVRPAAHAVPAAPPHSTIQERHLARVQERLAQAKQVERSAHINKFGGQRLVSPPSQPAAVTAAAPVPAHHAPQTHAHPHAHNHPHVHAQHTPAELPQHAVTHHQAMAKMALSAAVVPITDPPKSGHTVKQRHHLHLSAQHGRVLATASAVAIMGGYIWLQNYPKLALQTASSQAGLSATLPGYLPSSYHLKDTTTQPGSVTLTFSSPSAAEPLKINQHSTTWDSNSLLDNFVAAQADSYSTVQSQGLTIYLFNNNQASWVNHGIWYSIEGASRLSREQILKIAYSL